MAKKSTASRAGISAAETLVPRRTCWSVIRRKRLYCDGRSTSRWNCRTSPARQDAKRGFVASVNAVASVCASRSQNQTAPIAKGTICNVAYECEGPIWSGQIGYYDLSLVLGRDIYGECILTATVGGEEQDAVYVTGCKDMSATIVLYDGTTIAVACKICSCEEDTPIDLPTCLCSPVGSILHYAITGSGSGACSLSGEMEYTDRFLNPSWVSGVFTLPTTPTPTEVKLKLSCVTAPGFPVNGFTAEDLTEVNSGFWYEISFISADETTALNTTNPANYRDPDTLNGWVGRCRDGFFAVGYFLNDLCGGIGDGLVSVVITE
jgi:hypothetical protein